MSKHYQNKFLTEKEAKDDAATQSKTLKLTLGVIKSNKLYYVDSNIEPMRKEILVCTYKDGKVSKS